MATTKPAAQTVAPKELPHHKEKLYTVRDWKEYLGESLLIMFSVVLALVLTEYFNHQHEKENTKKLVANIVTELEHNRKAINEMQHYNLQVLKKIDSVLADKNLQHAFVSNEELNLKVIAPDGLLYRYLDNEAWTIAKANNITSKVPYEAIAGLTKVYEDQEKMMKVEAEVAKVIFDRNSRDEKQVRLTLFLIRDMYYGWAVDRAGGLVRQIDTVIKKMNTMQL